MSCPHRTHRLRRSWPRARGALLGLAALVALPGLLDGARADAPPEAAAPGVALPLLPDPREPTTPAVQVDYVYTEPGQAPVRSREVRSFSAGQGTLALRSEQGGAARHLWARGEVVYEVHGAKGSGGACTAWYSERAVAQAALLSPRAGEAAPYAESGVPRLTEDSPASAWLLSPPLAQPAPVGRAGRDKDAATYLVLIDEHDEPEQDPDLPPRLPPRLEKIAPLGRTLGTPKPARPAPVEEELAFARGRAELWTAPGARVVVRARGELKVVLPEEPARRFTLTWEATTGALAAPLATELPAACERPLVVASGREVLPTFAGARLVAQRGAERELRATQTPEALLAQAEKQLLAHGYQPLGPMTGDAAPGLRLSAAQRRPTNAATPKPAEGKDEPAVSLVWKRADGGHVVAVRVRVQPQPQPQPQKEQALITVISARGNGQRVLQLRDAVMPGKR